LWSLEKRTNYLYEGGYFTNGEQAKALKRSKIDFSHHSLLLISFFLKKNFFSDSFPLWGS